MGVSKGRLRNRLPFRLKIFKNVYAKDGVIMMKVNSILFLFLGMAMAMIVAIPKTRRWLIGNMLNIGFLRRNAIRIGMSIPMIRNRVIQQAMPNFD